MADLKSIQDLAIAMSRAQGACAGLQTALDLLSAAGLTGNTVPEGLALSGIQSALEGAKANLARAEDAWLIAVEERDFAADGSPRTPRTTNFLTRHEVRR